MAFGTGSAMAHRVDAVMGPRTIQHENSPVLNHIEVAAVLSTCNRMEIYVVVLIEPVYQRCSRLDVKGEEFLINSLLRMTFLASRENSLYLKYYTYKFELFDWTCSLLYTHYILY
jgi:glutamyl-tRNA reductase